jgi:hypothetical protein
VSELRRRVMRWMMDRMVGACFADEFASRIGRNPEDYDEIAYRMLCGLLGVKWEPPRYTDVGGREVP